MRRRWFGALVVGALVAMAVTAVTAIVLPVPSARALEPGSISGFVVDGSGRPISGATARAMTPLGGAAGSATSAADGAFIIGSLGPGTYVVAVDGGGPPGRFHDGAPTMERAAGLSVSSGTAVTGLRIGLGPGGTITGHVTSANGRPLAGVLVSAESTGGFSSGSATTGADGAYELAGVPVGDVAVRFTRPGSTEVWWPAATSRAGAELITVDDGATRSDVDVELLPGGSITGTVSVAGTPEAEAEVRAWLDGGAAPVITTTDADGHYRLDGLAAGVYRVEATAPGAVGSFHPGVGSAAEATAWTISGIDSVPGVDFDLGRGASVVGAVTGADGLTLAGVTVTATGQAGIEGVQVSALTASDGAYRLDGLPNGAYLLSFAKPGFVAELHANAFIPERAAVIEVTDPGQVIEIAAQLALGGAIAGQVTDADGLPLAGVDVQAVGPELTSSARTGADGHYTISGLLPGRYRIGLAGDGVMAQWWPASSNEAGATAVEVTGGFVAEGRNAALTRTGAIHGRALVGTAPWRDVFVRLTDEAGETITSTRTSPEGTYRFGSVPGGRYLVLLQAPGYAPVFHDGAPVAAAAAAIVVATDDVDAGDTVLREGGALAGRIVIGERAAAGVDVAAWLLGGEPIPVAVAVTEDDGTYRIPGLAPGAYALMADGTDVGLEVTWLDRALDVTGAHRYVVSDQRTTHATDAVLLALPSAVARPTTTTTRPPTPSTTTTSRPTAPAVTRATTATTAPTSSTVAASVPTVETGALAVPTVPLPTAELASPTTIADEPTVPVDGEPEHDDLDDESDGDEESDELDTVGDGRAFSAVVPVRVFDSRLGEDAAPACAGATRTIDLRSAGALPPGGDLVALNITTLAGTATGELRLTGGAGGSAAVAFSPGSVSTVTIARPDASGHLVLGARGGCTDVLVDLLGWFSTAASVPGGLRPSPPRRAVNLDVTDPLCAGAPRSIPIPGAEAGDALVLSVTAGKPTKAGSLRVGPTGSVPTGPADLWLDAGQARGNLVVADAGTGGALTLTLSGGCTPITVDVLGVFTTGPAGAGGLTTVERTPVLDTSARQPADPICSDETIDVPVLGTAGVPSSGVSAVLVSVTVTNPTAASFVTVFPTGAARPSSSTLGVAPGRTAANLALASVGEDGSISVYNASGCAHLTVTVQGWFAAAL